MYRLLPSVSRRTKTTFFACITASAFALAWDVSARQTDLQFGRQDAAAHGLTVVSLNTAKDRDAGQILRELGSRSETRNADLYLLQEVWQADPKTKSVAEQLADALDYKVMYAPAATGVPDLGIAIVSRYPLRDMRLTPLKSYNLMFRSRSRIALAATVDTPHGPLRVVNTHLDTRINTPERLEQLRPVLRDLEAFRGPKLIGGDFNSNNFYWVGHVLPLPWMQYQARGIRSFLAGNGFTTPLPAAPATFDHLGMHLDWIFVNGIDAPSAAIYPMGFSDHHAVWARLAPPTAAIAGSPAE